MPKNKRPRVFYRFDIVDPDGKAQALIIPDSQIYSIELNQVEDQATIKYRGGRLWHEITVQWPSDNNLMSFRELSS